MLIHIFLNFFHTHAAFWPWQVVPETSVIYIVSILCNIWNVYAKLKSTWQKNLSNSFSFFTYDEPETSTLKFVKTTYELHGGAVGWGDEPEGRGFDSRWGHWIFFHWLNPSGRTMSLGSTKPLTEMITREGGWCVGLTNLPPWYVDSL
jgi:hypothetical protein